MTPFEEGYAAYIACKVPTANPYMTGTPRADEWMEGFTAAHEAAYERYLLGA